LAAAANCVITTHFVPTVAGAASGTLSLFSNAGSSPNTVALSGTGVTQAVLAPAITLSPATGLNFNATVGTSTAAQTVMLTNSGNAVLTLTGITSNNAAFAVTHTCGTSVAAGASCTITAIFTPVASGQVQALISMASNVSPAPAIAMVGTGVAVGVPTALLHWNNAAPFSFGTSVAVGTRMAYSFTLSNAGAASATGVLLALSGPDLADFNLSGSCLGVINGVILPAGGSCQITVTFAPTTAGAKSVSLGMTAQGGAAPAAITLSATALASTSSAGVGNLSAANSSGGCTLGRADESADPLWLLMLGAAALVLRRRRSLFLA
jgi:hypothetical protein